MPSASRKESRGLCFHYAEKETQGLYPRCKLRKKDQAPANEQRLASPRHPAPSNEQRLAAQGHHAGSWDNPVRLRSRLKSQRTHQLARDRQHNDTSMVRQASPSLMATRGTSYHCVSNTADWSLDPCRARDCPR